MASARRCLALAAAVAAALCWSAPGSAEFRDYLLGPAQIVVQAERDGSLQVRESIEFNFVGTFTGAYRDIPLRQGESIDRISVSDTGPALPTTVYRPGASAELGSTGDPGTFGVARLKDRVRIVWHFVSNSLRTFTISYRLRGLAVAYDDVVDVNMRVWGDQWPKGLSSLSATIRIPARPSGEPVVPLRVWGHPATVKGAVDRVLGAATLTTLYVPPHRWVELHTVFPRSLLDSTAGAKVVAGPGLQKIVAEEHQAVVDYEYGRNQVHDWLDHLPRTIVVLIALALGPALLLLLAVWLVYGREPKTGYDREYEQQPPSDLKPALVLPLVEESKTPTSQALAFTATLFDLIRRGVFKATPTTSRLNGKKDVPDLELSAGKKEELESFEEPVAEAVDGAVEDGPVALTALSGRLVAERTANAKRFQQFYARLALQIVSRKWYVAGRGGRSSAGRSRPSSSPASSCSSSP